MKIMLKKKKKLILKSERKQTYIIVIGRITNYCEKISYKIFKDVYKKRWWWVRGNDSGKVWP
jgi:hypothetical protein